MTAMDETLAGEVPGNLPGDALITRWQQVEAWLGRCSDSLNPILVKEARQALRSRQFTLTFFVMLAAGWTWSILGLALLGPQAYYTASGPSMFTVYYVILAAPLVIAIPYYAYSSLASERSDRTFELVSITALEASGILTGKLGAIGLQMMIYLSALFPCLAFTYLLRGLDIFSVMLVVLYTCLISIGLAMLGLLLATLAPSRQRYILVGILFAVLLFVVFIFVLQAISAMLIFQGMMVDSDSFWDGNLSMAIFYLNALAIVFFAARARLLAPSQNRSTALRVAMSVATLSAIGCVSRYYFSTGDVDLLGGTMYFATILWFAVGTIIVGEAHHISPRIRRDLPRTTLGRVLLSWFMPGSGTGYLFVLANMLLLTLVLTALASGLVTGFQPMTVTSAGATIRPFAWGTLFQGGIAAVCYLAIYLGLSRLILLATRRPDDTQLPLRILVGLLLLLFFGCGPWIVQLTLPTMRNLDYSLLQTPNPFWTLSEFFFRRGGPPAGMDTWLMISLPVVAIIVWLFNLPSITAELAQARVETPARVIAEDQQLAAAAACPTGPTSPWDQTPADEASNH